MSYYGNPYQQFFTGGGNTPRQHHSHPFFPQQSFNIFTAPETPHHRPSHPGPFGNFGHHVHGQYGPSATHPHDFGRRPSFTQQGHQGPRHQYTSPDLDEEEQAALAHLESIRQRREAEREAQREAEQAAIRREAAIRAQVEHDRREALHKALEEKAAREAKHAKEVREAREKAIIEAIEQRQRQHIRRLAVQQAVAEYRKHQEAEHVQKAQAQAQAQARAACQAKRQAFIDAHRARHQQHQQQQQQQHQQQLQEAVARRTECAKRCATRCAQKVTQAAASKAQTEYKDEFAALNDILGGLFGINLVQEGEEKEEKEKVVEQKKEKVIEKDQKVEDKSTEKHVKFDAPAAPSAPTPTPAPSAQPTFPEEVNDLLTQFLGLRVEPISATSTEVPAEGNNNVPKGLNEFLSQFGLVFEPLEVGQEVKDAPAEANKEEGVAQVAAPPTVADPPIEPLPVTSTVTTAAAPVAATTSTRCSPSGRSSCSASASASTSAPHSKSTPTNNHNIDEAPLTSFLNSFTDLPPFVRDILGNVELAFKEEMHKRGGEDVKDDQEVKGKGKGVAEGEKKRVPIPIPVAPTSATTSVPVSATNNNATVAKDDTASNASDSSTTSLSTLSTISDELSLVLDSFTFPPTLSFGPSSTDTTPALLFNKTNSGYHAQANKLLQLLLAADGVASGGNKDVRRKRKEVVGRVEKELEDLEGKRDEVWKEVKERRANGEVEEVELGSASTSESGSTVDVSEDHTKEIGEHVEAVDDAVPVVQEDEAGEAGEKAEKPEVVESATREVEGFDVPSPAEPTESQSTELDIPTAPEATDAADSATPSPAAHPATYAEATKVSQVTENAQDDPDQGDNIKAETEKVTETEAKKDKEEDGYELL